jgi:hypothetical protein
VDQDNPVRVIEDFVEALDLKQLGFSKAETKVTPLDCKTPFVQRILS